MAEDMEIWETVEGIKFLRKVGLRPGQTVLDFGCRVGHYTIPAARVVGENGLVYAIDTEEYALKELHQKAKAHNLTNIRIIKTSGRMNLPLESREVDVILLYDVLHYLKKDKRTKLYHETFRLLRRDGLLSVYPKHTLEDDPIREFKNLRLNGVRREIEDSEFYFEGKYCGIISHDDGLNHGCVLNFGKRKEANERNRYFQGNFRTIEQKIVTAS
jgi:ubiquinone/menaquinone biosynthesis C-methylase UbiE